LFGLVQRIWFIWERNFRVSEKFEIFLVPYRRSYRKLYQGHQMGPQLPEGPHVPSGGAQAYVGLGNLSHKAHADKTKGEP
jgi:hypothetical protein